MKRTLVIGFVLALTAAVASAADRVVLEDGYAATVNEKVITIGDVLRASIPLDRKTALSYQGDALKEKLQDNYVRTLQALVEREMILAEARRRELTLPEKAVDSQINSIIRERFDDNRALFLQALSEQGMSYAEYRDQTADDLRVMLLRRQEVIDRIVVAPKSVREAYDRNLDRYRQPEEIHLRMILLNKGETAADEAAKRRQAEDARARIGRGEPFADVARQISEGPKTADGGDLGWVKPAELRKEFAAAVAAMKPGEVSPVIDSGKEFCLLTLEARRAETVKPFEEARAELERELEDAEADRLRGEWMSGLRVRHHVRMLQPRRPEL